jgi:hypothetical protein
MGVQWNLTVTSRVEINDVDVKVDKEALYIKGHKYEHEIQMTRARVQATADMQIDDNYLCQREVVAHYCDHYLKPKIKLETTVGSVIVSVEDLLDAINKVLYGDH